MRVCFELDESTKASFIIWLAGYDALIASIVEERCSRPGWTAIACVFGDFPTDRLNEFEHNLHSDKAIGDSSFFVSFEPMVERPCMAICYSPQIRKTDLFLKNRHNTVFNEDRVFQFIEIDRGSLIDSSAISALFAPPSLVVFGLERSLKIGEKSLKAGLCSDYPILVTAYDDDGFIICCAKSERI